MSELLWVIDKLPRTQGQQIVTYFGAKGDSLTRLSGRVAFNRCCAVAGEHAAGQFELAVRCGLAEPGDRRVAVSLESEKHCSFCFNFLPGLRVIEFCKQFLERVVAPALNDECTCAYCGKHFFSTEVARSPVKDV